MVWTYFSRWTILNLKKIGVVHTKYPKKKILNLIHQPSAKNIHTGRLFSLIKLSKTTQRCSSNRRWSSRCQSPSQGCWGYLLNTSSLISLDHVMQWNNCFVQDTSKIQLASGGIESIYRSGKSNISKIASTVSNEFKMFQNCIILPTWNQNDCADRVTTSVYRKTHGVLLQRSIEWWFAIWYMLQSAWGNAYEFEIFQRPYDRSSRFIRFLFPCSPSTGPFNFNWFHLQENVRGRPQAKTSIPKTLSSRVLLGQPVLAKLATISPNWNTNI